MTALLVSFIGDRDLDLFGLPGKSARTREPQPNERSPLLRVVDDLIERNLFAAGSSILLLDDREPKGDSRGRTYAAMLEQYVAQLLNVDAVCVNPHPLDIADPTDLDRLHKKVVEVMKSYATEQSDVLINLTSGTPAMHTTLVLAASYLPLKRPRFFKSSQFDDVNEIQLPYMVYVKRRIEVDRAPNRNVRAALRNVDPLAGIRWPALTVRSDPAVAMILAAIARARCKPLPILVAGPTGSGKTRAALTGAFNAGLEPREIDAQCEAHLPSSLDANRPGKRVNLIIKHLECASESLLRDIGSALDAQPDVCWSATVRTDHPALGIDSPLHAEIRHRLSTGGEFVLPSPSQRTDIVEVAESMFEELGQWPSKVKERFQYDLATAALPDGFHTLRRLVAAAAALSPTRHTSEKAFRTAEKQAEALRAAHVLQRATAALCAGGWGLPVTDLLKVVEHATLLVAEAANHTQDQLSGQLGYSSRVTYANRKSASAEAYRQFVEVLIASGSAAQPVQAHPACTE